MSGLGDLLVERLYAKPEDRDPVRWVRTRLHGEVWSKQAEIMHSVRDNKRTAVKSCHGIGKSKIAAYIIAEFLDTHPPGEAFAVTTAPTFNQVRAILWRYIGQAHRKGKLRGRVTQTEWHIGEEIVGYGRKPSDYDEAGFQGIHAPRVLVVIDESSGVPYQLWTAIDTLVTNDDCRILAIGNPDNPESHFAAVCQPGSGWNVITISAFDSPNFTGEKVSPKLAHDLVSRSWVDDAERNWGKDSPLYISKVLGEFPTDSEDGIVPASKVALCRAQDVPPATDEDEVQLGVDVGAGGDQSIIRERRGMTAGRVWRSRHDDPELLTNEIMHAVVETGATRVAIDVIGIGWGIKGSLIKELREHDLGHVDVIGVNVGEASTQPKRHKNLRSELWWEVGRELTMSEAWNLGSIDDQTAADLTAPKYSLVAGGRIQVEKKDEVRKRLGRSPDDADALLLAFYRRDTRSKLIKPRDLHRAVHGGRPGRASVTTR